MDIYQTVTDRMINEMEQGIIPWKKPWIASGAAVSHTTGREYSLLNQMLLGKPGEYLTFRQVKAEGGYVRKGERGHLIVFWKWIDSIDEETGEITQIPFLRHYTVFSIDQCVGISAKHAHQLEQTANPDETAESIVTDYIKREGIQIVHEQGNNAYYSPAADKIVLPLMEQFAETSEYYGTAFHEIAHSSGHPKRLARIDTTARFGSEDYSKEELVAEISASALIHHCGLETQNSFHNSTAYVQNWLQVLKSDKRFIVSASTKAEKAVAFIIGEENGDSDVGSDE